MFGFQLRPGRTIPAVASSVAAQALFRNGEQGVLYDPSDLSTLFQDAAGTTPVTAAGQPVGLMLDKRLGLVRGPELVTNGSLASDTVWTKGTGWTISGGTAQFTSGGSAASLNQPVTMVAGRLYEVVFTVNAITTGSVFPQIVGSANTSGTSRTTTGTFTEYLIAPTAPVSFSVRGASTTTGLVVDNVSVRELPGNHASQPTAASRPILRQNATTAAYYLEFDGSDDFLVTNSIDFTLTDKVTVFAGVRKLSDLATAVVVELSASAATNNGAFVTYAPSSAGLPRVAFSSRGTAAGTASYDNASVAAPVSAVVSGVGNIGGDSSVLRVNGAQVAQSLLDQGTGNYGNYPLYIGRRAGTGLPFNGHFYGLTIVGRLTTDAERNAVERLYAAKTGVTLT